MHRVRGLLLVLALFAFLAPVYTSDVARAQGDGDNGTAEDAARQIAEARDRANAAADAWSDAQSKLDLLADEKDRLDGEVADLEQQAAELQKVVETVAVNRYIGVGTTGIPLLAGNTGPTEQAQTAVLVGIVNEASAGTFDQYNELLKQLDEKRQEAATATENWKAAQQDFDVKHQAALDEIERLRVVEKDRLTDEAVMRAFQARRQKDLEAMQKAAADQLARDQAAALASEGGGSDGGDEGQGQARVNIASASSSGGTTGGGGTGARFGGVLGEVYGLAPAWQCPLTPGVSGIADSWGAPRSGGRTHEGIDMLAPRGTEIFAVVDGTAVAKINTLGGNTVSLTGDDGHRYYYAHLESWGTLGRVTKGTVVGYVGDTGNAIGTPHLHFEIHPMGGPAVNPYPTVKANC